MFFVVCYKFRSKRISKLGNSSIGCNDDISSRYIFIILILKEVFHFINIYHEWFYGLYLADVSSNLRYWNLKNEEKLNFDIFFGQLSYVVTINKIIQNPFLLYSSFKANWKEVMDSSYPLLFVNPQWKQQCLSRKPNSG